METTILFGVQGLGSGGLSKQVAKGDDQDYYMGYGGLKPTQ